MNTLSADAIATIVRTVVPYFPTRTSSRIKFMEALRTE
jgi:hypothetical protein